jgi:hypothetical protein
MKGSSHDVYLDLSDKQVFPVRAPERTQALPNIEWDATSRADKYLFRAEPLGEEIARRAGSTHIEKLFSEIWSTSCEEIDGVTVIDPIGHPLRSWVIWMGAMPAATLGRERMAQMAPVKVCAGVCGTVVGWGERLGASTVRAEAHTISNLKMPRGSLHSSAERPVAPFAAANAPCVFVRGRVV